MQALGNVLGDTLLSPLRGWINFLFVNPGLTPGLHSFGFAARVDLTLRYSAYASTRTFHLVLTS
jgi:hypothetical protein